MIISRYFVLFVIGSFLGWVYECIFCTVQTRQWQNRGFLYGPVCPIYGIGVVGASLIVTFLPSVSGGSAPWWQIFIACAVGSAILEYSTSAILERRFHAKWWDYSDKPLNVNGRICLPYTLAFGVAGVFVTRYILPLFRYMGDPVHPLLYEGLSLFFMALIAADTALTVASLTSLLQQMEAATAQLNAVMESAVQTIGDASERVREVPGKLSERARDAVPGRLPLPSGAPAALTERYSALMERGGDVAASARASIRSLAGSLNSRQRYSLRSVVRFTDQDSMLERMRQEVDQLGREVKEDVQEHRQEAVVERAYHREEMQAREEKLQERGEELREELHLPQPRRDAPRQSVRRPRRRRRDSAGETFSWDS